METNIERTKLIMDDENTGKIKNFINELWKDRIDPFLENIAEENKIDKDFLKICLKEKFQKRKIKLSKYSKLDQLENELPIDNELPNNKCIARVWGDGCGKQCSGDIKKHYFCELHYKKFLNCVNCNCVRGICGLGACNKGNHGGLWLGSILKDRPEKNDKGENVIQWKNSSKKRILKKLDQNNTDAYLLGQASDKPSHFF